MNKTETKCATQWFLECFEVHASVGAKLRPCMLLQVRELPKAFLTVGAAVGFDAQVDSQVLRQVRGVGKGLGAVRTLVSLGLCVRFRVNLHV